uniref:Prolipoprotein n=1 Tax=Mycoplasma feriruminatoris TaxID=1179777 RepID=A0A654ICB1_9MOLU|nr:hypothetical protein MF5292_00333 [Mycoplasma feriruminatoris]VZR75313.1 hypothetical protein MF5294_00333 [Mycoplasma feriruminatoris]VZR97463.1 hypothetical protein MF5293_00332 [Mycoplasma feriruminatoris]
MKKLIAILSSMMMITTASLPIIACHTKQKETKFENNNSIANAQTTASLFAKELILADQLKVNLEEIKKEYNNKSLTDLLKDNNLKLDNTDSSISDVKTLNDLVDKYFEKDSYKSGLDSKIKLDSETKKPSIPLFSEIFKLIGLGTTDLDKYSDDILKILELTTSLNPMFLVTGFDSVNSTLKSSFEKVKPYLKEGLEKLSNPKVELAKEVEKFQDKIDVNVKYKDLKLEDLDNAFYTTLVNAIGLSSYGDRYNVVNLESKDASKSLKGAAEALKKALSGPAKPATGKELDIAAYILEALQFLQIKLSLFESARDYTPKAANNLFDDKKTNQDFIKQTLNSNVLGSVAKGKSSINLKYIFSFFKKSLDELRDENKKDGFELQKLLSILFLSPNKVEYPDDSSSDNVKDYYQKQSAHPIVTILTTLADNLLNAKLKPLLPLIAKDAKENDLKKVIDQSLPHLYKWISYAMTNLLTGTKNVYDTLSALFNKVLPEVLTSLKDNLGILKEIDKNLIPFIPPVIFEGLVKEVLPIAFPITAENMNDKNSFKQLYSGEVFLSNKINEMFKQFWKTSIEKVEEIKKFVPKLKFSAKDIPFGIIRNLLSGLENGYDKIFKNVKEFNLKGLLTTPLNKIDEASWKDRKALKPLQSKSVADILDTILTGLDVKGNEKLAELTSSNINLTGLTDVAKVMDNYTYKAEEFGYKDKKHLLEILKSNPDKTLEIIGWTSDKKEPIGKGSLLYTVLTKVFNIDLDKKDNKSENAVNQISKVITTLNNSLDKLIIDESSVEIKFEFKDAKKNKSDQLLSETLVAKVKNKNDKSESTYSFSYLRDKQDKFKFTKITKN